MVTVRPKAVREAGDRIEEGNETRKSLFSTRDQQAGPRLVPGPPRIRAVGVEWQVENILNNCFAKARSEFQFHTLTCRS